MRCNFLRSFSPPIPQHPISISPQYMNRRHLSPPIMNKDQVRSLSPQFNQMNFKNNTLHNQQPIIHRPHRTINIPHPKNLKKSSVFEELDVQTSQSLLIEQKSTPIRNNVNANSKLLKVQSTGLPSNLKLFSKVKGTNQNQQLQKNFEPQNKSSIQEVLQKDSNFVTLGQLTLSDKPPTLSSQSSYDMKHFMVVNPFTYSIQSSRDKTNLKKITEEESQSQQQNMHEIQQNQQDVTSTKMQTVFSNIFSKKGSTATDPQCDTSQEKKKVAISLITGKDTQTSSRYSLSPSKQMNKIPSVQQVYMQPLNVSIDELEKNPYGLQSFNPNQFQQLFKRVSGEDKSIQTSLQIEENVPPEPEKQAPLMHNSEESYRKKEESTSSTKKSILRKSKNQISNSTTTLFHSSVIEQQFSTSNNESLKMVEELETDKMKLSLFMKPNNQQIIFAGMTKKKSNSQLNKEQLYIDLKDLFTQCTKHNIVGSKPMMNQYIRIDNLEQSVYNSQKLNVSESLQENLTLSSTFSVQNSSVNTKEEVKAAIKNAKPNEKLVNRKSRPAAKSKSKQQSITPTKKNSAKSPNIKSPLLSSYRDTLQSKQKNAYNNPKKLTKRNNSHIDNKNNCKSINKNEKENILETTKLISEKKTVSIQNSEQKIKQKKESIHLSSVKEFGHSIYDEKSFK